MLRRMKEAKTEKRCSICGKHTRVELHHLNYRDLMSVDTSDLRWMCRNCHQLTHDLMRSGDIRFTKDSHHHRFAVTKAAIKKHLGFGYKDKVFNVIKWD